MNSIDNTESEGSPAIVKSRSETVDTQQSSEAVSLDSRISEKPETPTTARENHVETPRILENRSEVVSPATMQQASEVLPTESSNEFFSEGQKVESSSPDSIAHETSTKEEERFSQAQETDASSTTKNTEGTASVSPFEDAEDEEKKDEEDKEEVKEDVKEEVKEDKNEAAKEKEETMETKSEEMEEQEGKDEPVKKKEVTEEEKEVHETDAVKVKEESKENGEVRETEEIDKEAVEAPVEKSKEESETTNEEKLVSDEPNSTGESEEDPTLKSSTEETPKLEEVSESQVSVTKDDQVSTEVKHVSGKSKEDESTEKSLNCSTSLVASAETSEVEIEKSEILENSALIKEESVVEGENVVIIGSEDGFEGEVNDESIEPSNISTSLSDKMDLPVRTNAEEVMDSICNNSDVQSSVDNLTQVPSSMQQIPTITTVCDDTKSLQDGVPQIVSSNVVARDKPLPNGSSSPNQGPESQRQNSSPQKRLRSASTSTQVDPNHFG